MSGDGVLLRRAEVDGHGVDVRVRAGRVHEIGPRLVAAPGERVVDAAGGALIPGLVDHHLHLLAAAAAAVSVRCGPPAVRDAEALAVALSTAVPAQPDGWLRGIGYHESVAGPLDRWVLDRLVPDRPCRVQHRSGALWVVNAAGCARLGLDAVDAVGIERDERGRPTGRLWRMDDWLRRRLQDIGDAGAAPDLRAVGRRLAAYGVTTVTDATADLSSESAGLLVAAAGDGSLPQRLVLLGLSDDATDRHPAVLGPRKIVLEDHAPEPYDDLVGGIRRTHATGRAVAVHCVTRAALVLALAALTDAGTLDGDRIEHAAVAGPAERARLAELGVRVVTQPAFVAERGLDYLNDVEPADRDDLWPYASLLAAGVRVAPASDAPHASLDPWRTIAAAVHRRTASGVMLGPDERVAPGVVLDGLLSPPLDPGGPARRVDVGVPADLCLLSSPLAEALSRPSADAVRMTLIDGRVVWSADLGMPALPRL